MILIVGASGSGKDKVLKELVALGYEKAVTYTSRKPRPGEVDGHDYNFVTKEYFASLIGEDFFAEYAIYDSNYYGTPWTAVRDNIINIVEPNGLKNLIDKDEYVAAIYIDVTEVSRFIRMIGRGDDRLDAERRLNKDASLFTSNVKEGCDIVFDNNNLITPSKIDKLVEAIGVIQTLKKGRRPTFNIHI